MYLMGYLLIENSIANKIGVSDSALAYRILQEDAAKKRPQNLHHIKRATIDSEVTRSLC